MNKKFISKVAKDTFAVQFNWALWFISIVFAIFVVARFFVSDIQEMDVNFLGISAPSSKIFMLICGILVCFGFLEFFIGFRITRKQFFYGITISSILISIALTIVTVLLQGLAHLIDTLTPINFGNLGLFEDGSFITIMKHIILLVSYYAIGWLISIGYYRFGGLGGTGFVLIALGFLAGIELIWEGNLSNTMFSWLNIQLSQLEFIVSLILSVALILINYLIIKRVNNRISVKVN